MPRKGRGGDWNAKRGQAGVGRWERDIDIEGKGWQAQKAMGWERCPVSETMTHMDRISIMSELPHHHH
jgi:hypothetical protein